MDYLQLIAATNFNVRAEERVVITACVQALGNIARTYDVPVFLISSVARDKYNDANTELNVFAGSQGIDYGSDNALFLQVDGKPLYQHVARLVAEKWNSNGQCALVVGATFPAEIARVRAIVGDMPLLVPGIGELCGASQREERYDVLLNRIRELGLNEEDYWWYLDLRRFGGNKHAGFGLGFERMVMYLTGISNIRDVLPFPRTTGSAEF